MTDTYLGLTSLVITAISVRLWFRALVRVEIPKNRGPFVAAWGIAAGLAVTALLGEPGWLGGIAAGLALLPAGFFPFSVAISRQKLGALTAPRCWCTHTHGSGPRQERRACRLGQEEDTTNNRMEMMAAIASLEKLPKRCLTPARLSIKL